MEGQGSSKKLSIFTGLELLFNPGSNNSDHSRQSRDMIEEEEDSSFYHFLVRDCDGNPRQSFSYERRDAYTPNPLIGPSMRRALAIEARSQRMISSSESSSSSPVGSPGQKFRQSLGSWGLNCFDDGEDWEGNKDGEEEERTRTHSVNSTVLVKRGSSPDLARIARVPFNTPVTTPIRSPDLGHELETTTIGLVTTDTKMPSVQLPLDQPEITHLRAVSQEALGAKRSLAQSYLRPGNLRSPPLGQIFWGKAESQSASKTDLILNNDMSILDLRAPKYRPLTPSFFLGDEKNLNSSASSWLTSRSTITPQSSPLYEIEGSRNH